MGLQGLPASPTWGKTILASLRGEGKIKPLFGVGCSPAVVHATRNELMEYIGEALKEKFIAFPEHDGPIVWPTLQTKDVFARQMTA